MNFFKQIWQKIVNLNIYYDGKPRGIDYYKELLNDISKTEDWVIAGYYSGEYLGKTYILNTKKHYILMWYDGLCTEKAYISDAKHLFTKREQKSLYKPTKNLIKSIKILKSNKKATQIWRQ